MATNPEQLDNDRSDQSLDDRALIRFAKRGNIAAFEQLVATYDRSIYNMAYRMLGNPDDARDVAQETFLRAYRSLKAFREEASFSTWIFRIAKNACLDELRKRGKVRLLSIDEPLETEEGELQRELPSDTGDPVQTYEQRELAELVQVALESLTEEYRTAVVLRDLQGFSYEEIAEVMEVSLGTVKSRIHRGREALKAALTELELFPHADVETSERRPGT